MLEAENEAILKTRRCIRELLRLHVEWVRAVWGMRSFVSRDGQHGANIFVEAATVKTQKVKKKFRKTGNE